MRSELVGRRMTTAPPPVDTDPPRLDEHTIVVAADAATAWRAVLEELAHAFGGTVPTLYAWAVGCADHRRSGPGPLTVGSTIAGFRVVTARPPVELVLAGRHRFSRYEVAGRLEPIDGATTRVHLTSRASFPGLGGRLYRLLVVRSGFHVLVVRRLLLAMRRRAESV